MSDETLYSSGEISRLCNITKKTLRHYEEIGLLVPSYIDPDNHYKYYSCKDLLVMNIVKKLKYQGFSLDEIKTIVESEDVNYFKQEYRRKQEMLEKEIEKLSRLKKRIANRLELFERSQIDFLSPSFSDILSYELKEFPERTITFYKEKSRFSLEQMLVSCNRLQDIIRDNSFNTREPFFSVYHGEFEHINLDQCEVDFSVLLESKPLKPHPHIRTIPGGTYVCYISKGSFHDSQVTYRKIAEKLSKMGYQILPFTIRIYVLGIEFTKNPEKLVTEMQVPVSKTLSGQANTEFNIKI